MKGNLKTIQHFGISCHNDCIIIQVYNGSNAYLVVKTDLLTNKQITKLP